MGDARLWIEHYCRQQEFDVVYFPYPYFMECPQISAPMVATPHDFNYKRFSTLGPAACAQIEGQMPGWLEGCRRIVVSSDFIASELRHFYPGFAHKVRVVRVGIPASTTVPTQADAEACRARLGLPQRFLLTVGWIVPHKNQKVVVEAIGCLHGKGISIPVVFVGPNSDKLQPGKAATGYVQEILHTAEDLGLQYGRDYLGLGYVDDFELECLYRLATALVAPSLYEAGSFPAREAMRAGCPVVYSRIPPLVEEFELVEGNAWLFEPSDHTDLADVLEEVVVDHPGSRARSQRARDLVPRIYCWNRTAREYLAVFEELVS